MTYIEPSNLFVATLIFGFVTELLGANRVDKNIVLMMFGQWLLVAGIVWWGINMRGVMGVLAALFASQVMRVIRRMAVGILDYRDDGRKKARVREAAAPYLDKHCRGR